MCLIAVQMPGDSPLSDDVLRNGWDNNPDGAGYMFASGGRLIIRKPFYKLAELTAAYHADHRECGASSPFVVHFRWATHGNADAVNVHPHKLCQGRVGLVHNGILDGFNPPKNSALSDTAYFCRTVLAKRQPSQIMGSGYARVLEKLIGPQNKFVLLDETGRVRIINEKAGVWDGSRWYSNATYKTESLFAKWGDCRWPVKQKGKKKRAAYERVSLWSDAEDYGLDVLATQRINDWLNTVNPFSLSDDEALLYNQLREECQGASLNGELDGYLVRDY